MQRDLEYARRFANEKLLADLLPVLDNLERGLAVEAADAAALRGGVELTLRELVRVVEANGLQAVDPVGLPFDPDRHHAMNAVEGSGQPRDTVISVFQKGYVLNDRLLRPAMVSVAKDPD
jgi:molecular chaperone GrpE